MNAARSRASKRKGDKAVLAGSDSSKFWGICLSLVSVIGILGYAYFKLGSGTDAEGPNSPSRIGVSVALVAIVLIAALFLISSGLSLLGLGSKDYALGLPDGSIRALIALLLIQVFVVFGIYLHSTSVDEVGPFYFSPEQVQDAALDITYMLNSVNDDGTRTVWLEAQSEEKSRMAQQILTMVGTLVVAVAGFYFGSNSVTQATDSAIKATTVASGEENANPYTPFISNISPVSFQKGTTSTVEVQGVGFKSPIKAYLRKDGTEIRVTDINVLDFNRFSGQLNIPNTVASGVWKLAVIPADATESIESSTDIEVL